MSIAFADGEEMQIQISTNSISRNVFKFFGAIFVFISLTISVAMAVVMPPKPKPSVTLSWEYPADQLGTNLTFKVYHSTDITQPIENWTVLTNVVGTNLSVKIPTSPGAHFFALTASNANGESGFATVSP